MAKLIAHGADVHAKTEDEESVLLGATTHGHTEIVELLMEAGARKNSAWMGINVEDAAMKLKQGDTLATLRAYESFFMGNILPVRGCACVVSWPGVYCRLW